MTVTRLDITSRTPFAGGQSFGSAGPYEDVRGTIHFAVDPFHTANRRIVDLAKASRDADSRIHFKADFRLFRPADPARANRRLLLEVVNRGRQLMPFCLTPAPPEPTADVNPGDGFLMRQGWTVAWCGWQWDVIDDPALIGLDAPQALEENGLPIQGQVVIRFQPNEPHRTKHLSHYASDPRPGINRFQYHRPYPAADLNDPDAQLFVHDHPGEVRTEIPRTRWRFAREDDNGNAVPDDTFLWLDDPAGGDGEGPATGGKRASAGESGGFQPGRIYELRYRTRVCPVAGAGLIAVRDCVSFLRSASVEQGNPVAGLIDHTYGYGQSQCGRFLRDFLLEGMNLDEAGRQVFDGLIPHVAGARRGEFNHRYAQPSAQHSPGFGHLPPFHDLEQHDPGNGLTGNTIPGLLDLQRRLGGVPKIFHTNSSSEYWRSEASLVHSDTAATRDVDPAPEARVYVLAGTEHGAGMVPPPDVHASGARCANQRNTVHYGPLMRALLVALDRWVSLGEEPPESAVPRLANGTAATRGEMLAFFRHVPGAALPQPERLPTLRRLDLDPAVARGVPDLPAKTGEPYPCFVSTVDEDGNEVAGIRLPDVTVPLASHTGWNPRHESMGGRGEIVDMLGSTIPFPRTREEGERTGDPRRSIAERYRDCDDYLTRVRTAAQALVTLRHLLPEDVDVVLTHAAARYDFFRGPDEG
ncbi:MAG TPA: alpha/beta hydrolase domain-containing protein [Chloroflexota bacterium]|nr:alpha/beta hydrolase domain-containing protein [Chloroflexota bacterium]